VRRPTLIVLIVLLSLLLLAGLWQLRLAGQDHGPFPVPSSPGELPSTAPFIGARVGLIGFEDAEGWAMAASDPADKEWQESVFVTNRAFAEEDLRGAHDIEGILRLAASPALTHLVEDGVLIEAAIVNGSPDPLPPNANFPALELPLQLPSGSPNTSWEGFTEGTSRYVILATVNGREIDVRVYFGTTQPNPAVLIAGQEELDRLFVQAA
jgi:hypothetical protein